ncbi:MAG: hypothetical protein JNM56_11295 [Planctomycetia bacterium]|nr:hypothetical protein [Planctomycetia bacterium]
MFRRTILPLLGLALGLSLAATGTAQTGKGLQTKVKVGAPTRLDWTYVLATKSLEKPPANWLPADYDSTKQVYDLYVPPDYDAKKSYPVVLFVSPGDGPGGVKEWEPVCKQKGIIFAAPHNAGNNCPTQRRVRIILDVLDDVRRNFNTDADRTYITGFSGGGRIAGAIAQALPEYFGGSAPICASADLRDDTWLQHRLIERQSVALVTGETDFNRGECERFKGPWLSEMGVRAKVWVVPKLGHAVPNATVLTEVFDWLEAGLPKRRELAKKFPTTSVTGKAAPARAEIAASMLQEGKQRLQAKETTYSGLMLLVGCATRFDDAPASKEARELCAEYDGKAVKPWEEENANEERRFALAKVRALDAYASGPLPDQYVKQRAEMAKAAIVLWAQFIKDGQDAKAIEQAKQRIPALTKLAEGK